MYKVVISAVSSEAHEHSSEPLHVSIGSFREGIKFNHLESQHVFCKLPLTANSRRSSRASFCYRLFAWNASGLFVSGLQCPLVGDRSGSLCLLFHDGRKRRHMANRAPTVLYRAELAALLRVVGVFL